MFRICSTASSEDVYKRQGDCVSYAAAFAYLANAVGMKKVYVICSGGHGWAEIGGKVYDPDWALVSSVDSYFAMSYDLSGVNEMCIRDRAQTAPSQLTHPDQKVSR